MVYGFTFLVYRSVYSDMFLTKLSHLKWTAYYHGLPLLAAVEVVPQGPDIGRWASLDVDVVRSHIERCHDRGRREPRRPGTRCPA